MIGYRDGCAADAAMLSALSQRTFAETFGHLYKPEDLAAFLARLSVGQWSEELVDPRFAVHIAEDDGQAVGFIKIGPPALPFTPGGRPAELKQLYVLSDWHGKGVAAALMDWAIAVARARDADALHLSVFVDNHRAKRFYAKRGFERVGTYAFMVGDHGDEDDIMRLQL